MPAAQFGEKAKITTGLTGSYHLDCFSPRIHEVSYQGPQPGRGQLVFTGMGQYCDTTRPGNPLNDFFKLWPEGFDVPWLATTQILAESLGLVLHQARFHSQRRA